MIEIRYVQLDDKKFWYGLDRHLPDNEFEKKVRDKQGYVLLEDNIPIGLLRFNLFWDNRFVRCCSLIGSVREKGLGKYLWNTGKKI
jgi:hypothetical protein